MTDGTVAMGRTSWSRVAEGDLEVIVERFRLGAVVGVEFVAEGMMNPNWRLRTAQGDFALKRIVDVSVEKARRSLNVLGALASMGLPVCSPRLVETDPVLDIDGRGYCVLDWAGGAHRQGTDLSGSEARALGALLGSIHTALGAAATKLPIAGEAPRAKVATPQAARAEADRFLDVIAGLDRLEAFDVETRRSLERRRSLILIHAEERPGEEVPVGPTGWTHGDFQPLNVLWDEGAVSAVLDWDRLAVRPYGEEVVRTAQVQFGTAVGRLDLDRVAAFVNGYRNVVPLGDEALVDAVRRLWWKRMTDFWQLQWHYDKGDHGPDALWTSGESLLDWWCGHRAEVLDAFLGH